MPQPDILKKIVAAKKIRLRQNKSKIDELIANFAAPPPLDFEKALKKNRLAVIAEIKKASPSLGVIAENFSPANFAKTYKDAEADAISVLTEEDFFLGKAEDLAAVKKNAANIPVLRKDFIIDSIQIREARAIGADSFLLICAILSTAKLRDFISIGHELGMEPLVETHDEREIEKALNAGAKIIGINNRDLRTFKVSLDTSLNLVKILPPHIIKVSESGIKTREDCRILRDAGFDAILVGETLMKNSPANFAKLIRQFKV